MTDSFEHLYNIHAGETIIIIGNGPSLADVPNSFLERYISFGSNGIFLKFLPTYYACMDNQDVSRLRYKIAELHSTKFIDTSQVKIKGCYKIIQNNRAGEFSYTPHLGLWGGYTVTFAMLQITYFMGFTKVLLVGVDHRYSITKKFGDILYLPPNANDTDHFCPEYHSGARFNNPNPSLSERSYKLAKLVYENDGRTIINLTKNTALKVFEQGEIKDWETL